MSIIIIIDMILLTNSNIDSWKILSQRGFTHFLGGMHSDMGAVYFQA